MRRAPVVSLIAGLTLALTACTDEPEPSGIPSNAATSPATTAPSSTPPPRTPPTAPAAVTEQTDDGAKAAAIYFVEALEYFYNTGDPTVMQSTATPDCKSCNEVVASVGSLYDSGGRMETGSYEVDEAIITENYSNGARRIDLGGLQPQRDQYDESDVLIKTEEETPLDISIIAVFSAGKWAVQEFAVGV